MTIDLSEVQLYLDRALARLDVLEVMAPDEMWEMAIQQVQNDLTEVQDLIAQHIAAAELEDALDDYSAD